MTNLSPVVICKVHDLLWCPWALDGHWRESEDGIASLKFLEILERLCDSF